MLQILSVKDGNYSIIDFDKMLILNVDLEELWCMLVEDGVAVHGLSIDDVDFSILDLDFKSSECNWINGENLFLKTTRFIVGDNSRFTIWADKRAFSGVIVKEEQKVLFKFDFGMRVLIAREDFDSLLSGDRDRIIATLKSLGNE